MIDAIKEKTEERKERNYRQEMPAREAKPVQRFAFCAKCWQIHSYMTGDPGFWRGEYTDHYKYITAGIENMDDALQLQAKVRAMREAKL